MKQARHATLDWRFDQPNDFNLFGQNVLSLAATKPIIDQIKSNGFNGISLALNVPIDPESGKLTLYDNQPGAANPNKNLPKDTWAVVQYARKKKLDVSLEFNIVNYHTDEAITSSSIGSNFSTDTFFKEVAAYESKIAKIAKLKGVSVIEIGSNQTGLDSATYKDQWQNVVDSVRKNFNGKLSYSTHHGHEDPIPWSMVDIINLGAWDNVNGALQKINSLSGIYNKPVHLDGIFAGGGVAQSSNIRDILKASIIDNSTDLIGLNFSEYAPWQQSNWIQKPQTENDRQWLSSQGYVNDLYNVKASDTFKNWFNYSTKDIIGDNRNNKLETFAGDKLIDGKGGLDALIVHNNVANCKIVKDNLNGGFDVYNGINGVDGRYDMYGVEYVVFNDKTVSLIGNYDLSKYGWFN